MESKEKTMFQRMMGGLPGTKQQLAGDRVLRCDGRAKLGAMLRCSISALAFVALPALSAGINDTGISFCANDASIGVSCDQVAADNGTHPRQNGRYGRDAQASVVGVGKLNKIGKGQEGFDFTKISNSNSELPASAPLGSGPNDWACTRDNVTGLTWEVKTSSGPRSQSNTYSWYNSDVFSNGGAPGYTTGSCNAPGRCDTEKFVADVNATGLCGPGVWRLPTVKELEGLADFGIIQPAIDPDYFPNTRISAFWSATASSSGADASFYAWMVDALDGSAKPNYRARASSVRLVRGGS